MSEYDTTPIGKLTSIVKTTPTVVKLSGKTLKVKTLMSKKGNQYQLVAFADNTGIRVVVNCTPVRLEVNQNYDLLVKATKKSNYSMNLFLDRSKVASRAELINPVVNSELEWLNEHVIAKELIVKSITPVVKSEDLYSSLNKDLDTYGGEPEPMVDLENQDVLLKLEDESNVIYYYRVWANDQTISASDILVDSIIRFEHIDLNKQKGENSPRNITKSTLSTIQILD